jgi:hypothetical protein
MFKNKIFYFASIRKLVLAFGSLFDDINIQKIDDTGEVIRTIKVPFAYGPGQPFLEKLQQAEIKNGNFANIESILPRISFEFGPLNYDANRKLNAIQCNMKSTDQHGNVMFQLAPVPYDVSFNVNIYTELMDDSLQILEQILPYFNPSFNVTVQEIPELGIIKDVPILLNSVDIADQYEGNFQNRRIINWTLSFVCKGDIFPPIRNEKVIRTLIDNIYTDRNMEYKSSIATITTE